uniref:Uncharacterized protein n=1 Tax=Physcomitrium patens TaxID=3218 RepID=A0A2K1IVC8_PHYPA|nr:hypothetical protein PHYPA_025178 [Physcomitrium patens]
MEELNFYFCDGISNISIVGIAQGCKKSLQSLEIATCAHVTNVALKAMGTNCNMLKKFTLDSEYIEMDGISQLAIRGGCKKFKKITLNDSWYVGDRNLVAIDGDYSQLEALEINHYHKIGIRGLQIVGHLK